MRKSICLSISALLSLSACGPAPAPTSPKTEAKKERAQVAATPGKVEASTAYQLSPVAEPSEVVGVLRWKSPQETLNTLAGCASLPPQLADASRFATEAIVKETLRGAVDANQLAQVIALDAPVLGLVTLEPGNNKGAKPMGAISFGLNSLEKAKGAAETRAPLTELMPGVWKVGGRTRDVTCVIAASAGSTPARLVCGPKEKDLLALTPYLTRTAPTLPPGPTDFHAEFRVAPLEARFGPTLRGQMAGLQMMATAEFATGDEKFDKALRDAATALADEVVAVVGDLDKFTVDFNDDPKSCATAGASIELRGKTSWIAGTIIDRPERAGAPPAIFWRAPKDSGSVFYARGGDTSRVTPIMRTLRMLVEGALDKAKFAGPADRKAIADLFTMPIGKDKESVSASGAGEIKPLKAGEKLSAQGAVDGLINGWFGWSLVGIEESADPIVKYVKDLVAVYNRKGIQDPIKKELRNDAKFIPTLKTGAAPASLGKGALAVEFRIADLPAKELDLPGTGPKDKVTLVIHVLVMPDGKDRTWVAFGASRDELVKRLLMVKTGAPDSETIASRPGLEPLKNGRTMSGGYFVVAPLLKSVSSSMKLIDPLMNEREKKDLEKITQLLGMLPHKGETPLFLTTTVTGGDKPTTSMQLTVPKEAFEDVGSIVKNAMQMFAGGALAKP